MSGDDEVGAWDYDEAWAHFPVPPPPPPPSLGPAVCELQQCRGGGGPAGAHFNRAAFPSLPIVAVCSSVVLVAVLVASFLLWRHKTKVQNLLPCKNEQQGHLGDMGAANGVTYEDVLINHHPTRLPQGHLPGNQTLMPLEILDLKLGDIGPTQLPPLHHPPCYPTTRDLVSGKTFNPVYEEVSQGPKLPKGYGAPDLGQGGCKLGSGRSPASDEDFGDEECSATSSVQGSTGGDLCRDPVSSDEGNGEDCEFMVHDLPHMLPGENTFSYSDMGSRRDRRNYHPHSGTTYQDHRTVDVGHKLHSKPHQDRRHMSPSHAPMSMNSRGQPHQWRPVHDPPPNRVDHMEPPHRRMDHMENPHSRVDHMNFPASASQENIYSTIDEDDLSDYPCQPPLPSLACSQPRGGSKCKGGPGSPGRGDKSVLSQRGAEENGSSYGDMMPAFHSTSFM